MNSVTYVLYKEDVDCCLLIDCGEYATIRSVLDQLNKKVKAVLITHGHSDHISGLKYMLQDFPELKIYASEFGHTELEDSRRNLSFYHGSPLTFENYKKETIDNNDFLHFEGLADIEVIATPGHSPSCLTYKIGKDLFTGDSYIPGIKVVTSFPGGNKRQAKESLCKLKQMETNGCIVHCGHHSY